MAMASFSITSPRSAVIDYSAPYYHSGFALLSIEREAVGTNYFSFMDPYGFDLWAMIIVAAVVTFLSMVSLIEQNQETCNEKLLQVSDKPCKSSYGDNF